MIWRRQFLQIKLLRDRRSDFGASVPSQPSLPNIAKTTITTRNRLTSLITRYNP